MSYLSLISEQTKLDFQSTLTLAIIVKIWLTLHMSKNSGSKYDRRETESVSSKHPYAGQLGYRKPVQIPFGLP